MTGLGIALFLLGFLIAIAAGFWTIILAFMEHTGWGFASLFLPFAGLVFIIIKWSKKSVRRSFFLGIVGWIMILLGGGITLSSMGFSVSNIFTIITSGSESEPDQSQS